MNGVVLLIDAGNTRIKLGWVDPATGQRERSSVAFARDELATPGKGQQVIPSTICGALGVNVAGADAATRLQQYLNDVAGRSCPIRWVSSAEQAHGVTNRYRPVSQLGADRWASMLGLAWHERRRREAQSALHRSDSRTRAVLATFGTATTIDTLAAAADGFEFPGGLILPGPDLMHVSLSQGTANLPRAQAQATLYPTHTHEAIASGVAAAQAGALIRQWLAAFTLTGAPPVLYASGGAWPQVQAEVQRLLEQLCAQLGCPVGQVRWLASPVLDGLACVATKDFSS